MKTVTAGRARHPEPVENNSTFERQCPQCGKIFLCFSPREWCYRMGDRIFCSWTCYRERERGVPAHAGKKVKQQPEGRRYNPRYNREQAIEQTRQIILLKAEGLTNDQIAGKMHLTSFVVANRLQQFGRELGWVPMTKSAAGVEGVRRKAEIKKERRAKRSSEE